ncbi:MAG: T9SS type A sorting domain-containing protein [Saprospiraceae bacterium]|nr:T9SS type A sorting domain-containing protein [Lewinella sp.]
MKRALLLIFCTICLSAVVFAQSKQSASQPSYANKVEIQVFPNPVQTHFSINNNTQVRDIVIFNLVGKELKRFVYSDDERYFLGDLPKGIYLVQFIDKEKNVLTTRRISKR